MKEIISNFINIAVSKDFFLFQLLPEIREALFGSNPNRKFSD